MLVVGFVAGACGDDDDAVAGDDTEPTVTEPVTEPAAGLAGRTFLSDSVTENGQPKTLVEGTQIALTFSDDGRLSATAGCNSMGGEVTVEADRLVVSDLGTTLMGCDDARQAQDEWLSAVLSANPSYTVDGDQLRLEGNGSVIELVDRVVADPDKPLEGTVWQVDGTLSGEAASSLAPGVGATLVFGDGRVQVQVEGCNQGSATATIGESEIEFGPLAMTRMGCPPDVADFESSLTQVLDGPVTYELEASSLTLTQPSGNGLTLTPQ